MGLDSIYKGLVRDTNDPEARGRIRAEIPQIFGPGGMTTWAWPSNPLLSVLPDVGSVVYVMFESGHEDSPVWFSGGGGSVDPTTGGGGTTTGTGGERFEIIPFTKTGDLSDPPLTGDYRFYLERDFTLSSFRASLGVAADLDVIVDLLYNAFDGGGSVLATPLVIAAGAYTQATDVDQITQADLYAGQYLTINVLQYGATLHGADLVAQVTGDWGVAA